MNLGKQILLSLFNSVLLSSRYLLSSWLTPDLFSNNLSASVPNFFIFPHVCYGLQFKRVTRSCLTGKNVQYFTNTQRKNLSFTGGHGGSNLEAEKEEVLGDPVQEGIGCFNLWKYLVDSKKGRTNG